MDEGDMVIFHLLLFFFFFFIFFFPSVWDERKGDSHSHHTTPSPSHSSPSVPFVHIPQNEMHSSLSHNLLFHSTHWECVVIGCIIDKRVCILRRVCVFFTECNTPITPPSLSISLSRHHRLPSSLPSSNRSNGRRESYEEGRSGEGRGTVCSLDWGWDVEGARVGLEEVRE